MSAAEHRVVEDSGGFGVEFPDRPSHPKGWHPSRDSDEPSEAFTLLDRSVIGTNVPWSEVTR